MKVMDAPEIVTLDAMSTECGLASFQLAEELSFVRLEYDSLLQTYEMIVQPTSNL